MKPANIPGDPDYPENLGTSVAKFRRMARNGLSDLTHEQRRTYGDKVEKAILAKQRSEFNALGPINPKSNCASGTTYTTGEAIHEAIKAQQTTALRNYPAQVRRKRTDVEWRSMYDEAMKAKRKAKASKGRRNDTK